MGLHADILGFLGPGPEIHGRSILAGAADAAGRPHAVRAVGAVLDPERGAVSVFLAQATSEHLIRALVPGAPLAVCFNEPATHRTLQLKGPVLSFALADEGRRAWLDRYVERFAAELDRVGLARHIVRRLHHWPAYEIVFRPERVFDQTPGPGAGIQLAASGGAPT